MDARIVPGGEIVEGAEVGGGSETGPPNPGTGRDATGDVAGWTGEGWGLGAVENSHEGTPSVFGGGTGLEQNEASYVA